MEPVFWAQEQKRRQILNQIHLCNFSDLYNFGSCLRAIATFWFASDSRLFNVMISLVMEIVLRRPLAVVPERLSQSDGCKWCECFN